MEFRTVISKRRMVRNYTPTPVDPAAVTRIVAAGRKAPSAGFTQGQSFVVVTDTDLRGAIAELADEPRYVRAGFDPWISRAPVHVVITTSEAAYHRRYREPDKTRADGSEIDWPIPFWWVDAGASMMAILLAAIDEGLAAGFLGLHRISDLKSLLGMPDEVTPIGIVTIGHPAKDRRSSSLKRGWRPLSDVVHSNRWGPAA